MCVTFWKNFPLHLLHTFTIGFLCLNNQKWQSFFSMWKKSFEKPVVFGVLVNFFLVRGCWLWWLFRWLDLHQSIFFTSVGGWWWWWLTIANYQQRRRYSMTNFEEISFEKKLTFFFFKTKNSCCFWISFFPSLAWFCCLLALLSCYLSYQSFEDSLIERMVCLCLGENRQTFWYMHVVFFQEKLFQFFLPLSCFWLKVWNWFFFLQIDFVRCFYWPKVFFFCLISRF